MADDKQGQKPTQTTQKTQPKKGEPIEIPVPKFGAVRDAIRKVAKPDKHAATEEEQR